MGHPAHRHRPATILRGNPSRVYPHVRRIVRASGGTFEVVSEDAIREARRLVEELEGISPCSFAAAAAVAGVVQLRRRDELAPDDTVLVNLTGREREGPTAIAQPRWRERSERGWTALGVPRLIQDSDRPRPPTHGRKP